MSLFVDSPSITSQQNERTQMFWWGPFTSRGEFQEIIMGRVQHWERSQDNSKFDRLTMRSCNTIGHSLVSVPDATRVAIPEQNTEKLKWNVFPSIFSELRDLSSQLLCSGNYCWKSLHDDPEKVGYLAQCSHVFCMFIFVIRCRKLSSIWILGVRCAQRHFETSASCPICDTTLGSNGIRVIELETSTERLLSLIGCSPMFCAYLIKNLCDEFRRLNSLIRFGGCKQRNRALDLSEVPRTWLRWKRAQCDQY